jgi:hypothetical protein
VQRVHCWQQSALGLYLEPWGQYDGGGGGVMSPFAGQRIPAVADLLAQSLLTVSLLELQPERSDQPQ